MNKCCFLSSVVIAIVTHVQREGGITYNFGKDLFVVAQQPLFDDTSSKQGLYVVSTYPWLERKMELTATNVERYMEENHQVLLLPDNNLGIWCPDDEQPLCYFDVSSTVKHLDVALFWGHVYSQNYLAKLEEDAVFIKVV